MRKNGYLLVVPAVMVSVFVGGCMVGKSMDSGHRCEITVPYWIYPAMTIECEKPGMVGCDTLFTYRDFANDR